MILDCIVRSADMVKTVSVVVIFISSVGFSCIGRTFQGAS